MNTHCIKPQFVPVFGLFVAKFNAFWCKTRSILVQNARYFGAKRKAFWCKTRCILVLNARQNDAKCETKRINIHRKGIGKTLLDHEIHGAKWAKNTLKSAFLVAKC